MIAETGTVGNRGAQVKPKCQVVCPRAQRNDLVARSAHRTRIASKSRICCKNLLSHQFLTIHGTTRLHGSICRRAISEAQLASLDELVFEVDEVDWPENKPRPSYLNRDNLATLTVSSILA